MTNHFRLPGRHTRQEQPLHSLRWTQESAGFKEPVRTFFLVQLLSTWCIRISDFSLVLFLAEAIPGTLLYISFYGLARSLAALLLSSEVARTTRNLSRLRALQLAIACQRISVATSCLLFILLPAFSAKALLVRNMIFGVLVFLSCAEKLGSISTTVTIERDWVIVVARITGLSRHSLNASLRRIELFSKLASPLVISFLSLRSMQAAIWVVLVSNLGSMLLEFRATSRMWVSVPELALYAFNSIPLDETHETLEDEREEMEFHTETISSDRIDEQPLGSSKWWLLSAIYPWRAYFRSPVFLASFSNAILYCTVLFFGGQTVTYLVSTGFSWFEIAALRIASTVAELIGTVISPAIMVKLGPVRAGMWFMIWQVVCIAAFAGKVLTADMRTKTAGILLAIGITLKRIGICGSELAIQFIVQESVPATQRAQFSSSEMASQSFFEVLSFGTTAVFSTAQDFNYPVLISYAGIIASMVCYTAFARNTRHSIL
ncbi:Solute carrier family 40 member 1 [Colletotrichum truncatum]|uniref:Solute carrier family 40 member 1 n=1 Tax=Colletotrichum truncatum TaxID=5467 RepID=A0ACC3YDS2_COLTU|nr:Solute carrier family 40 member 1 [Colletotrichum truncatum]KAF6782453.1 Solute carrier family 40 member 1 [Colletotrichum truncatum]